MELLFGLAALGVCLALALLVTARRWIPKVLGALDRFLVRTRVGTWVASCITRLEVRARARRMARRAAARGRGTSGEGR